MKNKTGIKASSAVHTFTYDLITNVGIKQKENNKKRVRLSKSECMEWIVKHYKLNNDFYQDLVNIIAENGTK